MTVGWLALLMAVGTPAEARTDARFALFVGHNIGQPNEVALRWAEEDARRMHALFSDIGKVEAHRAVLLRGPTRSDLDRALRALKREVQAAKRRGRHTVVFFYYSGHGDDEALHLGLEALPISALSADLVETGAHTVVELIDACRNDRTPRAKTKGAARAPPFDWPTVVSSSPEGFVQLRSASAGEVAQESDDLEGSLFSYHVLTGLRGIADFDGDGVVTLPRSIATATARPSKALTATPPPFSTAR